MNQERMAQFGAELERLEKEIERADITELELLRIKGKALSMRSEMLLELTKSTEALLQ